MNYKISLAALVVAATVSGQAAAGDSADAVNALIALGTITPAGYAGVDGDVNTNTTAWATVADDTAACALGGVLCSGTDITKLEVPDAGFTPAGGLPAVLAAIDPIKDTLINLNLSNNLANPDNVLAGGFAGLDGFVALEKLALNGISADGVFPDMSASTSLNWVNLYDNVGITGMEGKLAGGSAITLIGLNGNTNMTGDMSSTLANIGNPANLTLNDSKVYGTVAVASGDVVALTGTDIIPTGDAGVITASGYDASLVVQAATGVTVTPGEETASIAWVAPAVTGVETGYSVSYTADDGVTLLGTEALGAVTTHTFSNMPAGTYKAVVQSTFAAEGRSAAPALSAAFDVTAAPLVCETGEELNEAGTACVAVEEEEEEEEGTTSSGGGGAAFWLIMLPLMGLLRRKSA